MNKGILKRYSLGFLCLIGLLASCSQEQPANDSTLFTGKPVEMRLRVNALAAIDNNETAINRLRMVVFGSAGSPDAGRLILNKYYATIPAGNALKEIITSGMRDIYLIVNEPLEAGGGEQDSYRDIATVDAIRALLLVYRGASVGGIYTPTEIPMFAQHLNQRIAADDLNDIGGAVERTMAKVTLNLNIKNDNFPAGKQMVIDHITIKNLPAESYWIARNYTGALTNSEQQPVGAATAAGDNDFSSTNTFYVPEYLFDDPDGWAYIEIAGHINGAADKTTKYKVKLGDAMDASGNHGTKYHITRNRHYTFTGDVKSYGVMDGVKVKVTVASWNTVSMDEDTGNGFIPNSVLTAEGWPADKLPPNGLQIAKRGNKVLPSGVAEASDPTRQWKTTNTTTGGTAEGLGMGVMSTAAMAGDEHPAAQYCRDMGAGWFLPSKDELKLIYNNEFILGASYTFGAYYFWSASEYDSSFSWIVGFSSGYFLNNLKKTTGLRVRCVKYI